MEELTKIIRVENKAILMYVHVVTKCELTKT